MAAFLKEVRGIDPFVLWERRAGLAAEVVARRLRRRAQGGPATPPPICWSYSRIATLMVSGGHRPASTSRRRRHPGASRFFGPTDPEATDRGRPRCGWCRGNGACECHYSGSAVRRRGCLSDVTLAEVTRRHPASARAVARARFTVAAQASPGERRRAGGRTNLLILLARRRSLPRRSA